MQINSNQPSFTSFKMPNTRGMSVAKKMALLRAKAHLENLAKDVEVIVQPKAFGSDTFVVSVSRAEKGLLDRFTSIFSKRARIEVDMEPRKLGQTSNKMGDALVNAAVNAKFEYITKYGGNDEFIDFLGKVTAPAKK